MNSQIKSLPDELKREIYKYVKIRKCERCNKIYVNEYNLYCNLYCKLYYNLYCISIVIYNNLRYGLGYMISDITFITCITSMVLFFVLYSFCINYLFWKIIEYIVEIISAITVISLIYYSRLS
jgi:hypothetical protein